MSKTVTLTECARLLGVSDRSIQRAIPDGFPVAERGRPGVPYRIDMDAARAWWAENRPEPNPSARARLDGYRAERERIRLERDLAQILDRADVERAAAAMLAVLREEGTRLSDNIVKRLNFNDEQRLVVDELIVAALDRAASGLSAISPHENRQ